MKLFGCIFLLSSIIIFNTAQAHEDCVTNCLKKERDGQVLLYKWIDETGKTKKIFTVDLAENALNITNQAQSTQSHETPVAPPSDEQGTYTSESSSESYETTTEIVVITTTKYYYTPPPFSSSGGGSGGKTLYDIQVHTQRVKKNKSS